MQLNKFKLPEPMVNLEPYLKLQKTVENGLSNVLQFSIDSFGSRSRYLTKTEARLIEQPVKMSVDLVNKTKANPKKDLYIETIQIGEGAYPKIYNIMTDGTYCYNERLSRYVLNNAHNTHLLHAILQRAILA